MFFIGNKAGRMGRKWHLFSNWFVALIAVSYCYYFVVVVCSGLGRWPWDTAGFKFFAREGGKDQIVWTGPVVILILLLQCV